MNKITLKVNSEKNETSAEKSKNDKNKQKVKYSVSCLFPSMEVRDIAMDIAKRY